MEERRLVVMGKTLNLPPTEGTINWVADLIGTDVDPSEPLFPFYYPIVANATDVLGASNLDAENHPVVGVIAMTIFWRKIFDNLLGPGSQGLIAVIGNDCNQTLTFKINGPDVIYLGEGDLHDSDYDSYEKFSYMATLGLKGLRERQYTGFQLIEDYCPYWIRLYPSDKMRDEHESNDPLIFTLVTVAIFIFTSLFFLVYDCVSERRQKKVLSVALQSRAVVSNLFPQVVRDRIFPSQDSSNPKERISTAKLRLQQFLRSDDEKDEITSPVVKSDDNVPIAELFSETTVSKSQMHSSFSVFLVLVHNAYTAYAFCSANLLRQCLWILPISQHGALSVSQLRYLRC